MSLSSELHDVLIDNYKNNKLSIEDLLKVGIEKDEYEFIADSQFYIQLMKDSVISSSQLIEYLGNLDCLTRVLENKDFLKALEDSTYVTQQELESLQTTHDVQNAFVCVFDDGFVDLNEIAKQYSKLRSEILEIFGKAASRDMYCFYKYGGDHSLINDRSDYSPSGMRSSNGVSTIYSFLTSAFENKDFEFFKDIILSFENQFKFQRYLFNCSECGLINFFSEKLLEHDKTFIRFLFEIDEAKISKILDGVLAFSYSWHASQTHRDNTFEEFQNELFVVQSILSNHSQEPASKKVEVYEKLHQDQQLKHQYVEQSKKSHFKQLQQQLETTDLWAYHVNGSKLFEILEENNIFSKQDFFEMILKQQKDLAQSQVQNNTILHEFQDLLRNGTVSSLIENEQFKIQYFYDLVALQTESTPHSYMSQLVPVVQELYEAEVIKNEHIEFFIQHSANLGQYIYKYDFLMTLAYDNKIFENFEDLVHKAQTDKCLRELLNNNSFIEYLINSHTCNSQEWRVLFDAITQDHSIFFNSLLQYKKLFQHMIDKNVFTQSEFKDILFKLIDERIESTKEFQNQAALSDIFYEQPFNQFVKNKLLSNADIKKLIDKIEFFEDVCGLFRFYAQDALQHILDNFLLDPKDLKRIESIIQSANWLQYSIDDLFDFIIHENSHNERIKSSAQQYKQAFQSIGGCKSELFENLYTLFSDSTDESMRENFSYLVKNDLLSAFDSFEDLKAYLIKKEKKKVLSI